MRVGHTVRTDQSVAVEVLISLLIVVVIIAGIGVDLTSLCVLAMQSLVYVIPDKSALELRILTYQIPILLEAAT